ncbi:MAG: hypothetical protein ACRECC_05480 [Pseudolabrys sp.]|jgi:hypothetical protein
MSINTNSLFPAAAPAVPTTIEQAEELRAARREKIVTIVATTLAVLVVATIAVLMGMA